MKHLIAIAAMALMAAGCTSDIVHATPEVEPPVSHEPVISSPDEYHQKIRTVPYPRSCNEIYVNPAPLIVPQSMAGTNRVQFELSADPLFGGESTLRGEPTEWCFFNAHRSLGAGRWFWHFRTVAADGTASDWSETYDFDVDASTPEFATPAFEVFLRNAPKVYPRMFCMTAPHVERVRARIADHREYKELSARAVTAMGRDYADMQPLYAQAETTANEITWLYQAYYLTQRDEYADKMVSFIESFAANPPSMQQLYTDNFTTSSLTYAVAACYDILYARLQPGVKAAVERWLTDVLTTFYAEVVKVEENHIFDNHFWQMNMRHMFQAALCIYDNPVHGSKVLPLLEYLYELWTARAPAGGFNRDGLWHNGTGYFNSNVMTLAYMPLILSYITGFDFMKHPWYTNAGRALSYTTPPSASNIGFGDMSEQRNNPNRQIAAFADFLSYYTGDAYASWYATESGSLLTGDWEQRLMRICRADSRPESEVPEQAQMLTWYRDCGEVAMHSSLFDQSADTALGFRSSTFGSGSHTTACQNAFNLTFRGHDVFRSSGYYQAFDDAHNLMSYRHTRAHNSVLVNGIGQPFSTRGYGRILRAGCGDNIAYALGDASNAYCGVSDDPMWIEAFRKAGIEQTPEFGFGETPLTKYLRHVAMLAEGTIVLYDELEASEASTWEWLLHSRTRFDITRQGDTRIFETRNTEAGYKARITMICSSPLTATQTSEWTVAPAIENAAYPRQWHLKASVADQRNVRYLAIIEVTDIDGDFTTVKTTDDRMVQFGDWLINASLDTDVRPELSIRNNIKGSGLFYGDSAPVIGDQTIQRRYYGSTMIVDKFNGQSSTLEMIDTAPASTRAN